MKNHLDEAGPTLSNDARSIESVAGQDQTRRRFIGRIGLATALPVVSALSLTWTKEAKAY
jgi:hypothetical protein